MSSSVILCNESIISLERLKLRYYHGIMNLIGGMSPDGSSLDPLIVTYQKEISVFPSELQTSAGILYAIVRSVVQHNEVKKVVDEGDGDNILVLDCHHYLEGLKLKKLHVLGPEATFLSLIHQAKQEVSIKNDAAVVELSDGMSMRLAKAAIFIRGSVGRSVILYLIQKSIRNITKEIDVVQLDTYMHSFHIYFTAAVYFTAVHWN